MRVLFEPFLTDVIKTSISFPTLWKALFRAWIDEVNALLFRSTHSTYHRPARTTRIKLNNRERFYSKCFKSSSVGPFVLKCCVKCLTDRNITLGEYVYTGRFSRRVRFPGKPSVFQPTPGLFCCLFERTLF